MPSDARKNPPSRTTTIQFWEGLSAEIDLDDIERSAMSVKGSVCPSPLRFLEIYANLGPRRLVGGTPVDLDLSRRIRNYFIPEIPGTDFTLGDGIHQPPYRWRECDPRTLAVNFTYNSSAIHRILTNLARAGRVPERSVASLFDRTCDCLAQVYRANDNFIMKNMNNNFSIYLIPKVLEYVLGKDRYDAERQEEELTDISLRTALDLVPEYASADLRMQMALALGKGVSFIEHRALGGAINSAGLQAIQEVFYPYAARHLAIDHRERLLEMIESAGTSKDRCTMVAVADDTAETVDDLLWMLKLLERYAFLRLEIVLNRVRVSVNFSLDMLPVVLCAPVFRELAARASGRLRVIETYCPLPSLQTNCLTPEVRKAIDGAEILYIKGANFFETLQPTHKDRFYAFVVYGPISRRLTGLDEGQGVFAYVPAGQEGYVVGQPQGHVITLLNF